MNEVRASVAMAVYNGEKYLKEQIDSILQMLTEEDELVISYDKSEDSTLEIIKSYEKNYTNIRCFANEQKPGISRNFTNAAKQCRGKYIFFSDQDDIWLGNKIETMIESIERENADLAVHNGYLLDDKSGKSTETLFEICRADVRPVRNFFKGRFLGCCMAFRCEAMEYVLPFPDVTNDFPHDVFAAIMAGIKGKVVMVPDCFIMHRLHEGNRTPKRRNLMYKVIYNRIILLVQIAKRLIKS